MNIKNLYVYLIAFFSSVLTFLFFYFSSEVIKEEKVVEEKIDIYEVAKEEAIKLGRMEPDEEPIVQEIGPDGKVIVPSITLLILVEWEITPIKVFGQTYLVQTHS